jgi:hypothetical protein
VGDVDGTGSTPYKMDQSAPDLNRYSANVRAARAIVMGTAPTYQQLNTDLYGISGGDHGLAEPQGSGVASIDPMDVQFCVDVPD